MRATTPHKDMRMGEPMANNTTTYATTDAAAHALAQVGSAAAPLLDTLLEHGVSLDAYADALADVSAYIQTHPEQLDTVRLMGGDEGDLVTALMAQWYKRQTQGLPQGQTAAAHSEHSETQAVTDGSDAPDAPDKPAAPISLASHRRARKRR